MNNDKVAKYYKEVKSKVDFEEFKRKMDEFEKHFSGLVDEETLALLTAYSFGYEPISKIEELTTKKGKVVVKGIVEKTFGVREFENGIVTSIILADESGKVKITLWNDAAKLVKTGDVIEGAKIKAKGFLKKKNNGLEISINDPSDIEVFEVEFKNISSIVHGIVNIKGRVSGFGEIRKIDSKDVEIAEIYVSDESGRIRVLLWGDKVEIYKNLDIGDFVEIRNGYVKVGKDGDMEIHCGWKSILKKLTF
ncbi:hypothetical protein DRO97_04535 [Archaeoglobales archaeon]|nr:MAG: hypothetical protein DRO97_04535 [Archaeoglobales archaeon]